MKKFFSILCVCLLSVFAFAGCEAKGSSDVAGFKFVQDVFYVDLGVETSLDYKIFPNSAGTYYVSYSLVDVDTSQDTYYQFSEGKVKVIDSRFEEITVRGSVNTETDECKIRLKEYPDEVAFASSQLELEANAVSVLNVIGTFDAGDRSLKNGEFVYKITSSDPSVIEVVDAQALTIKSTGRKGSSRIDLEVCNSVGGLIVRANSTITVSVGANIDTCYSNLIKVDNSYNDVESICVLDGVGEKVVSFEQDTLYRLNMVYFDEDGFVVESADCEWIISNDVTFEIVEHGGVKYLKIKDVSADDKSVDITIVSNNTNEKGEVIRVGQTIKINLI